AALGELSLHLADVAGQVVFLTAQALVELRQLRLARLDPVLADAESCLELDLPSLDRDFAAVDLAETLLECRLHLGELPLTALDLGDSRVQESFGAAQRTLPADEVCLT